MKSLTRRKALGLMSGIACAAACPALQAGGERDVRVGLAQQAAKKGLLFGSAMRRSELTAGIQDLYARDVGLITPGDELKMAAVRPTPETIDFSEADPLIQFAESHNMKVRGHTLIWNEWQPAWVHRLDKADIAHLVDRHIDSVVGHYRGRVHYWDVVNEPIGTNRGERNWLYPGPFLKALGEDYIARSFRRA